MLVWDATCQDTLAPSYANREAGVVAEAEKKKVKYSHLESSHHFVPVESLGVFRPEARSFFLGPGTSPLSHYFLLQRVSVAVQHSNTAAINILGSLESDYMESYCPT